MTRRWQTGVGVVAVALSASQLGHQIVYQLRFGAQGMPLGTTGVHAYMPALLGVAAALTGGALLTGLLLVAVSRLLVCSAGGMRPQRGIAFVDLLAVLFTLQLGLFTTQEVVESLVSRAAIPDAITLLLWASAGQLPVALCAALILSWLSVRFEAAFRLVIEGVREAGVLLDVPASAEAPARPVDLARLLEQASRPSTCKRGPPALRLLVD